MDFLPALTILLALVLCAGALPGYIARRFKPEHDSLIERIDALLPQTQCGQCGHLGCRPYAAAIAAGEAINRCPPGGAGTIAALARLLAQAPRPLDPSHGAEAPRKIAYIREPECIGCTKCIQACPVDAIVGSAKHMHTVIASECTGCDLCVAPCPVDCIDMIAHPSIAYPSTHLGKRATPATALPPAQACIRCGWCADACPVLLLPQQLYRFARTQELQLAERYQISDCIECGACAAVCPSNIALVQHFHTAKHDLAAAREKRRLAEQAKPRFDFHQARKQEEQAQETLRRQERAALVQTQSAFNSPAQTAAVPVLADHATAPSPQDVIQAALARVNAKKAERKSSDPAAPTTPSQNTENAPS